MTGQTLLNQMEVLDNELQAQSGEDDVVRSLISLNAAQDWFESLVAQQPRLMGDTIGTVVTAANTESTAFPTGLLRLDRLQFIDPTTSKPLYDLDPIRQAGGHRFSARWPYGIIGLTQGTGRPTDYYTDGRNIYWAPLPDAIHTVRWYGLQSATDITASGTFLYPDICSLPFASFASKLMGMGVGDDTSELSSLAAAVFDPLIKTLSNFQRDGAVPLEYTRRHIT